MLVLFGFSALGMFSPLEVNPDVVKNCALVLLLICLQDCPFSPLVLRYYRLVSIILFDCYLEDEKCAEKRLSNVIVYDVVLLVLTAI